MGPDLQQFVSPLSIVFIKFALACPIYFTGKKKRNLGIPPWCKFRKLPNIGSRLVIYSKPHIAAAIAVAYNGITFYY